MAIDTDRKKWNLLGFGVRGIAPWPQPAGLGVGDRYTLLGLALDGNDRWKVPFTHDSTYASGYDRYALVYDHASGTWVPKPGVKFFGKNEEATENATAWTTIVTKEIPHREIKAGTLVRVTSHVGDTSTLTDWTIRTRFGGVVIWEHPVVRLDTPAFLTVELLFNSTAAGGGANYCWRSSLETPVTRDVMIAEDYDLDGGVATDFDIQVKMVDGSGYVRTWAIEIL